MRRLLPVMLLAACGRSGPEIPVVPAAELAPRARAPLAAKRAAVVQDPASGAAWGEYGSALFENGRLAAAEDCLRQAQRLDPETFEWPFTRGRLWARQDPTRAVAPYEVALAIRAEPLALLQLGDVLFELGRLEQAEARFAAALAADPELRRARLGRARVAFARDDLEAARRLLEELLAVAPELAAAHELAAQVYARLGQAERAREHAAQARPR